MGPRRLAAALLDVFFTESTEAPARPVPERRCVDPAAPTTLFDAPAAPIALFELLRGLVPCCCAKPPRSWAADDVPMVFTDSTLLVAEPAGLSLREEELRAAPGAFLGAATSMVGPGATWLLLSFLAGATAFSVIAFVPLAGCVSWLIFACMGGMSF